MQTAEFIIIGKRQVYVCALNIRPSMSPAIKNIVVCFINFVIFIRPELCFCVSRITSYNVCYTKLLRKKNEDGSATIHFGGDPGQDNFLPIVPGCCRRGHERKGIEMKSPEEGATRAGLAVSSYNFV